MTEGHFGSVLTRRLAPFQVDVDTTGRTHEEGTGTSGGVSGCARRRALVATRPLPAGTIVLQSLPHAFALAPLPEAPDQEDAAQGLRRARCEWCAACAGDESEEVAGASAKAVKLQRCSRCRRAAYCSATCQRAAWTAFHSFECAHLWTKPAAAQLLDRLAPEARLDLVLLGRCVRARQKAATASPDATNDLQQQQAQLERAGAPLHSTFDDLVAMESHYDFLAQTVEAHGKQPAVSDATAPSPATVLSMAQRLSDNTQLLAVGFRLGLFGPSIGPDDLTPLLLPLLTAFQTNNFALTNGLLVTQGAGVYPLGALLNHSCDPNCVITYDSRRKGDACDRTGACEDSSVASTYSAPYHHIQVIRTIRPVRAGEELTHSYIDVCAITRARRHQLADRYYFHCECARCTRDEGEGDSQSFERFLERDSDGNQLPEAILDYSDCGDTKVDAATSASAATSSSATDSSSNLPAIPPARLAALQRANRMWRSATQIHLEPNTADTDAEFAAEESRRTRQEQSLLEQSLQLRLQHLHPHNVQVMATYSSLLQAALLNGDFPAASHACEQLCRRYRFAYGDEEHRRQELATIARWKASQSVVATADSESDSESESDTSCDLISPSASLPCHPLLGLQLYTLGSIACELKEPQRARDTLQRALDILTVTHGDRHPMARKLREARDAAAAAAAVAARA